MAVVETYPERYADPQGFAREVNLPLLGTARIPPVPAGAGLAQLLEGSAASESLASVVDSLSETRRSLTLRSLLLAGFPDDPECFAVGLSLGREWSRRGLRVAIVDLDFWNPTVVRPPSHPNEGLVDVLEYGCSFGRVAWEIVADRLWLIGPGSHPPDEAKIAEHPDWPRASRVFASTVDVTLYVAPLLDRRGFTGKLSKRMDAAVVAASIERVGRGDLRDAFLELWGSDAPMIGCLGIEPVPVSAARREPVTPEPSKSIEEPIRDFEAAARTTSAGPALRKVAPTAPVPSPAEERGAERALEAALERDVRRGIVERGPSKRRGRAGLWIGTVATLALLAGALFVIRSVQTRPPKGAIQAQQPAGEEPVAPAGGTIESNLASGGAASPSQDAAQTPSGSGVNPPEVTKPYRVHVASFRSEAKVQEIVASLKMQGLDAWYEPAADLGGWYRVFVGRFATEAEAVAYAEWLLTTKRVDRAQSYPQNER